MTLTDAQFRRHFTFMATNMAAGRELAVPAIRRFFLVDNGGSAHDLAVKRGATELTVAAGGTRLFYAHGTTDGLHAVGGGAGGAYDFGFVKAGTPGPREALGKGVLPRGLRLPADFAGAAGHVDVPPDDPFAIDVRVDAVSVGTITVAATGAFAFVTTGNGAKAVAAGAVVRFVAPDPADPSIAGIAVTLVAALA